MKQHNDRTEVIHAQLDGAFDTARVKKREQGGIWLDYLEGYDIIDCANRIFGYFGWTTEIVDLEHKIGDRNGRACVVSIARVRVSVHPEGTSYAAIRREDVGVCDSVRKHLGDAIDMASKGAVTDATKRALRTFGTQFGNALYDKDKEWKKAKVPEPEPEEAPAPKPTARQKVHKARDTNENKRKANGDAKRSYVCSKCGVAGHNARSCGSVGFDAPKIETVVPCLSESVVSGLKADFVAAHNGDKVMAKTAFAAALRMVGATVVDGAIMIPMSAYSELKEFVDDKKTAADNIAATITANLETNNAPNV